MSAQQEHNTDAMAELSRGINKERDENKGREGCLEDCKENLPENARPDGD